MSRRSLCLLLAVAALLLGCPPQIGNKCQLSTDCSQLGDRLCDTSQPDGYCTVFNCEPDSCPNAICVAFDPNLDPACGTSQSGRWPRFERSFCLSSCNSDSDCRDQYECVNLDPYLYPNMPNPAIAKWRAQVVDLGAGDGGLGWSVCMVRASPEAGAPPMPFDDGGTPAVCVACPGSQPAQNASCSAPELDAGVPVLQCMYGATVCTCTAKGWDCPPPPDAGCVLQDGGAPWCAYMPDGG